jgi:hypothetical protein
MCDHFAFGVLKHGAYSPAKLGPDELCAGNKLHIFLALDRGAAPQLTARCLMRHPDARSDADENSCVENYAERDARHIHAIGDLKSC